MKQRIYSKLNINFLKNIKFGFPKKLFFLLSLSYFCFYFLKNIEQISFDLNFEKYGKYIFFSFLFCILSVYLNAFAWKNIVIWFGTSNVKKKLISFYVLTNVLKYVPGGIWHFLERFNFIKDLSNPQIAFYSTLIEPFFMLSASFLLASIGIIFSPFYFFLILPSIFLNRKLIYLVLRKLESIKGKVTETMQLTNSKYRLEERVKLISLFPTKALLFEIGFILTKFAGFFICFNTINSFNNINTIQLFIVFCLAWSVGLVVPTAPSGVGVFEAFFLLFSGNSIPQNIILVSLIYFRLISTSADLLLSLPFVFKKLLKVI